MAPPMVPPGSKLALNGPEINYTDRFSGPGKQSLRFVYVFV